jgi:DNA-binding CsgD family transcriptional regulator
MEAAGPARPFGDLLERSSDAVFVVGPGFRIVWWGFRAEEMLGIPAARVVGRRCFDVFAGSVAEGATLCGVDCPVARALRHGRTVPSFCIELCVSGKRRQSLTLGFLVDASGEFLAHILREQNPTSVSSWQDSDDCVESAKLSDLTRRQRQVLDLILAGATSMQIARILGVTHATARNHVQNLLNALGVHTRLEAALLAERTNVHGHRRNDL